MSDINKLIAERITMLRKEKKWSQEKAAAKLSELLPRPVTRQTWCNWEMECYRVPHREHFIALGTIFGVNPSFIRGESNERGAGDDPARYITANSPAIPTRRGIVHLHQASDSLSFLVKRLEERELNSSRILLASAIDDSMSELLNKNDEFLIDLCRSEVTSQGYYALLVNNAVWIRKITPELDGSYTVSASDATHFPSKTMDAKELAELEILGRVSLAARWL